MSGLYNVLAGWEPACKLTFLGSKELFDQYSWEEA